MYRNFYLLFPIFPTKSFPSTDQRKMGKIDRADNVSIVSVAELAFEIGNFENVKATKPSFSKYR